MPPPHRPRIRSLAKRVDPMLGQYVRGVFIVIVFTTVVSWVVTTWILHMPNATLMSLTTGLLEPVPLVGPVLAAAILSAVSVEQSDVWMLVGVIIFYTALRLIIDQVFVPLVLGKAVTLHPVVMILSFLVGGFLVGGALFGIVGMLLAVPAAATVKIALTAYYDEEASSLDTPARGG